MPGLPAAVPPAGVAAPTVEAVERILAGTEATVAAINERAERQARQISTDLEQRAMEEALERRARLEQVRHELAERAAALLVAYEGIHQRLAEIDAALAGWAWAEQAGRERVTLRERQRISVPHEEPLLPGASEEP